MKPLLILIAFAGIILETSAQINFSRYPFEENKNYKLILSDESEIIGTILETTESVIVIKTSSLPRVEIPITNIRTITPVETSNIKKGVYWFENPNPTRYLFSTSGFNLERGEGYYQNSYLVFNFVNIGVSKTISVGGGFELISTVLGSPLLFFTPKFSTKVADKFRVGGGLLYLGIPGEGSGGATYALATYGTKNHNVTGTMGWGFAQGDFQKQPMMTLSGMTRVAKGVALVSENWLIPTSPDYYGFVSYGVRFFGEKLSCDLAFINNPDIASGFAIGIPYVDFVVKF